LLNINKVFAFKPHSLRFFCARQKPCVDLV